MKTTAAALLTAACLAAPALSQEMPEYVQTGTIDITFGDEQTTHYTTSNTVPGEPGRQVHGASWLILEPKLLGGVNISPDDVFVLITSRDSLSSVAGPSSLQVEASLHPETLALKSKPAATIRFQPDGESRYYALTEGTFNIESAARIDANNLSLVATAEGVMTGQNSHTITHNPDDAVKFSARLKLEKVANRGTIPLP